MVTINNVDDSSGKTVLGFVGLSSDEKPVEKFYAEKIRNGSTFLEIDTTSVFMYDEENKVWKEL